MKRAIFLSMLLVSLNGWAGMLLDKTRVIFPQGTTTEGVTVMNVNNYPSFVQMWVDKGDVNNFEQDIDAPFIVVPPIFNLQPEEIKSVRVIYNGKPLPENKESLYWLNIYEVPAIKTGFSPERYLLMSIKMQIKLIYRPQALSQGAGNAAQAVSCDIIKNRGYQLKCRNNSGYYISYSRITVALDNTLYNAVSDLDLMLNPFSDGVFSLKALSEKPSQPNGQAVFKVIDDKGQYQELKKSLSVQPD